MWLGRGGDGHRVGAPFGYGWHRTTGSRAIRCDEVRHAPRRPPCETPCSVKPGSRVRLAKLDPNETFGYDKASAAPMTAEQLDRLAELQDRFWAEAKRSVLVVLQGIDAAGKDGTIQQGHGGVQPAGLRRLVVQGPDPRGARATTSCGGSTSGRRARARSASSTARTTRTCWSSGSTSSSRGASGRSATTRSTTSNGRSPTSGTTIVKFFLSIDRDEQRERFQARYDDPTKRWKFSLGDLEERKHWDDYQAAFDDMLSKTSTDLAPWYVIPANRKWFRNLAVATILADTLASLKPAYPTPPDLPADLVIE